MNWNEIKSFKSGINLKLWMPVLCVILASALAWAGWNTQATHNAVKETEFEQHKAEYYQHVEDNAATAMQIMNAIKDLGERVEDKLDTIQRDMNTMHFRNNVPIVPYPTAFLQRNRQTCFSGNCESHQPEVPAPRRIQHRFARLMRPFDPE